MRLDLSTCTRSDLDLQSQRETNGLGPRPLPHGERVSISPEGREASRDASPAVRGEVRWYRAASFAHGGRRLAASANGPAPEPAGPRPAKTLSPQPRWIQNPRGAIDAYLRTMREAA